MLGFRNSCLLKRNLEVIEKSEATRSYFDETIKKLANLSAFSYTKEKVEGAFSFQIKTTEFYIPLASNLNKEEEIARLTKTWSITRDF